MGGGGTPAAEWEVKAHHEQIGGFAGSVCFYGFRDKLPHIGWFKTPGADSLPVQEARSPKSRCPQGCFLLEALRAERPVPSPSFRWLPAVLGAAGLVAASVQSLLLSSCGVLL